MWQVGYSKYRADVAERVRQSDERPYGVPSSTAGWDSVDYLLNDWARERPDLDFTPVGIVTRLAKVRTHLDAGVTAVFAAHGLTPADFEVIVTLRRFGKPYRLPQARLMDTLELTSGTVSVRLDRLESAGIVVREADPASARSTLVRLTDKGLALFDVVAPEHLANEDRLLSALTSAERSDLADLLRRLLSSFERPPGASAAHLGLRLESAPMARQRRQAVGLSDTPGLLISDVESGSIADQAGLARGDLIVAVDGIPVVSTVTLSDVIERSTDDQRLKITVLRGDTKKKITLRASPGQGEPHHRP